MSVYLGSRHSKRSIQLEGLKHRNHKSFHSNLVCKNDTALYALLAQSKHEISGSDQIWLLIKINGLLVEPYVFSLTQEGYYPGD